MILLLSASTIFQKALVCIHLQESIYNKIQELYTLL